MRGDTEVVAMIVFAIVGFMVGNAAALDRFPSWLDGLTDPLATLVAAYLGAYYAFRLNERRELRREHQNHVQGGNRVIFGLVRAYNQFSAIRQQFIEPHRASQFRAVEILPAVGSLGGFRPFDTDDVAIFIGGENPNLASEVTRLEMEISATLDLITLRGRTHLQAQAKLDAAKVPNGVVITMAEVESIIGAALVGQLIMATDDMIKSVDSIVAGCTELIPTLGEDLKMRFKGHRVIGMTIEDQQGVPADGSRPAGEPRR